MWTQKTNIQSGSEDVQLVRGIGGGRESVFWKMQRGLLDGDVGGATVSVSTPEISGLWYPGYGRYIEIRLVVPTGSYL